MERIEELAYAQVCENLRKIKPVKFHNPLCFCGDEKNCFNISTGIVPTVEALAPLKILNQVVEDDFKSLLKNELKKSRAPDKKHTYIFCTINPKPDILLDEFLKKINKTLQSEMFADHLAVIEQRGNSTKTMGQGLHAHILFKRRTPLNEGRPPTQIKRNLRDSYKRICLSGNNQIFNIQFINDEFAKDKFEYMIGEKTGKGKKEKQDYDKIFRVENKIPQYLGNINILKS